MTGLVKIFYPLFKPRVLQPVTLYVMRNTTIPETVNVNSQLTLCLQEFVLREPLMCPGDARCIVKGTKQVIQISPHCSLTMCAVLLYSLIFRMGASFVTSLMVTAMLLMAMLSSIDGGSGGVLSVYFIFLGGWCRWLFGCCLRHGFPSFLCHLRNDQPR